MGKALDFLTNGTPWLIQQEALESIVAIAQRHGDLEALLKERGEPLDNTMSVDIHGSVAVLNITGPLFPRANLFQSISGAMSVEMLAKELGEIEANSEVNSVVLAFDTPGGHVTMINEFSKIINAFSKPIIAYVVGAAASAGYWLAAAADKIVLDETAMVGSIGIKAVFKKQGGKGKQIQFVSSNAPDKAFDADADDGKKIIQAMLDDHEEVFINTIVKYRGMNREQVIGLRGGVVIGAKAIEAGFADEIGSLEGLISQLNEENPMDLKKLKADHPETYQAAVDVGVEQEKTNAQTSVEVNAEAVKTEVVTAERERIGAILGCEEAQGRGKLAHHIATATNMDFDSAKAMLSTSPKESTVAGLAMVDNQLGALNPDVGADADNSDTDISADDKFVQDFEAANKGGA